MRRKIFLPVFLLAALFIVSGFSGNGVYAKEKEFTLRLKDDCLNSWDPLSGDYRDRPSVSRDDVEAEGAAGKVRITFTVTNPSGVVYRSDGITEIFPDIAFTQYGEYTVDYHAVDKGSGRTADLRRVITVCDMLPPILKTDTEPLYGRVNRPIVLNPVSAYDFGDGDDVKVSLVILDPDGRIAGREFVFVPEKAGEYRLVYTAEDKTGHSVQGTGKLIVLNALETGEGKKGSCTFALLFSLIPLCLIVPAGICFIVYRRKKKNAKEGK